MMGPVPGLWAPVKPLPVPDTQANILAVDHTNNVSPITSRTVKGVLTGRLQ